jgi:hypothetical protein
MESVNERGSIGADSASVIDSTSASLSQNFEMSAEAGTFCRLQHSKDIEYPQYGA